MLFYCIMLVYRQIILFELKNVEKNVVQKGKGMAKSVKKETLLKEVNYSVGICKH